jgi:hypothetical protein
MRPPLVLVGKDEGMGFDNQPLHGLAALARHRVGAEEPGVLHELRAAQALEHGVDLSDMHRTAERPAVAIRAAGDGMEVMEQRLERVRLQP